MASMNEIVKQMMDRGVTSIAIGIEKDGKVTLAAQRGGNGLIAETGAADAEAAASVLVPKLDAAIAREKEAAAAKEAARVAAVARAAEAAAKKAEAEKAAAEKAG